MEKLRQLITAVDGKSYKAYKQLVGDYHYPDFDLRVDHVQGDPFANPSRCRVFITSEIAQIPTNLYDKPSRKIALEDFLGRSFCKAISACVQGARGSGMSGEMLIADYGQQILQRNAVLIRDGAVEIRIQIGLPANKRTITADHALAMLFDELPAVVAAGIAPLNDKLMAVRAHVDSVENQTYLRQQLSSKNLVAFIADGSRLARQSGVDERPMANSVLIIAPDSLAVFLKQCDGSTVRGFGITQGITLIVGGGFHGKSTLLHAIERGVYDHILGDGRERVVTVEHAVKIRAEDRRAISKVDISSFINHLPQGKDTRNFSTQDASGSTSQAANIMEALSTGSQLLLIDEDTSATNFMIRDERMQALVAKDKEPITPLVQRIADLKQQNKVSVILVMGGSGDFFDSADTVIMLDNYQIKDVTSEAQNLSKKVLIEEGNNHVIVAKNKRYLDISSLNPNNEQNKEKLQALETRILRYGKAEVDVSQVEQLVDKGQLSAIAHLMRYLYLNHHDFNVEATDLNQVLQQVIAQVEKQGLDSISPYIIGTLAMPRLYELVATINRMRHLKVH